MKDRILLWNDDNHEPCIWINNEFAGIDIDTVIKSALYSNPKSEKEECEVLEIYPWDFEDDFNDDDFDKIFDWFQGIPDFTEEQWDLVFEKNWKKLFQIL